LRFCKTILQIVFAEKRFAKPFYGRFQKRNLCRAEYKIQKQKMFAAEIIGDIKQISEKVKDKIPGCCV